MKLEDLLRIIADDDAGLLDMKPVQSGVFSADERMVSLFKEIETYFLEHSHEPTPNTDDVLEFKLYSRLASFKESADKSDMLRPFDNYKLLGKPVETIADIFSDDSMGLLDDGPDDIFKLRNVPASIEMPEKIAKRKPCKDFAKFEPLFQQCSAELLAGIRETRAFTGEQQIQPGHFFILHGITVYVAEVGEKERSGKRQKVNARLRLIFDNGTESNMLLRSLATELYKDEAGRRILDSSDKALDELEGVTGEDEATGHIYVLSSKSTRSEIMAIKNLYKIGFTAGSVEDRIKNAAKEATYLMAPVKVEAVFRGYNVNVQAFEGLLHAFFGPNCLDVEVIDANGKKAIPREWFVAPLNIIDAAVKLVINGEIVNYRYDGDKLDIVER